MSMTKAEKAALADAIRAAAVNRALRWSDPAPARDVPIPTKSSGWDFNVSAARGCGGGLSSAGVFRAWSSYVYSTRALALRALRAAIEAETAALLADIDAEIGKETSP